jgi:Flp pilus assembly protein CpaB
MQLTRPRPPASSANGPGPLSTRGGTLAVAAIAALLAGAALLIFLRQYRENLTDSQPVRVLVARSLVPKGTPGQIIGSRHFYRQVKVRKSQLEDGAVTDPATLDDKAAAKDIYPGHQLRAKDFAPATNRILNHLSGYARAITVPVDAAHGMIGKIQPGDHVDVVATRRAVGGNLGITGTERMVRNVLVLAISPKQKGSLVAGNHDSATLRVNDDDVARIAAAVDGGKVWLVLRPAVGARSHRDPLASAPKGGSHAKVTIDATVRAGR